MNVRLYRLPRRRRRRITLDHPAVIVLGGLVLTLLLWWAFNSPAQPAVAFFQWLQAVTP